MFKGHLIFSLKDEAIMGYASNFKSSLRVQNIPVGEHIKRHLWGAEIVNGVDDTIQAVKRARIGSSERIEGA